VFAVASLMRGERPPWVAVVGVLLNLSAIIPPLMVFSNGGS
jgi:hypothetical protein